MDYNDFDAVALGEADDSDTKGVSRQQLLPNTSSPIIPVNKIFQFQSDFDSTNLEKAIQNQGQGAPIVPSTLTPQQIPGYALGLHPSSQTPVAVQFQAGKHAGSTATYYLKPGQIIRPAGLLGSFPGFKWGLPFGWLGGGHATLVVLTHPDAHLDWHGAGEVIFHRARFQIYTLAQISAANGLINNAPNNWPMRFPWTQAQRAATGIANPIFQKGNPLLSITDPTRCVLALRGLTTLAAPATMRAVFQGSNDVGLDNTGTVVLDNTGALGPVFEEVIWPQWAAIGTSGNLFSQVPALILDKNSLFNRLAADDGGLALIDNSGGALANGYVDIVRYGKL
jgi:hypothetical protein